MKRAYADYVDSGEDCLGQLPDHWEVLTLGRLGKFFKGSGGTKAEKSETGYPCVWYGDLYTQHDSHITSTVANIDPELAKNYEQIQYGDLLFAGSDVTPWRIGRSAVNLITGRSYCGADTIVFRPDGKLDARYLGYLGDCEPSRYQKLCMGRGVTVMHIYGSELKYLAVPLPPLDEQRAIGEFLDSETARIDELISKQELLIDRLDEYRTALITQTVTCGLPPAAAEAAGLDPAPPLKDSGVEWLGRMPEHWLAQRLSNLGTFFKGGGGTKDDERDEGHPCIRYGDLYTSHDYRITASRARICSDRVGSYTELKYGDLLLAGSGETLDQIGKSAVNLLREPAFCGGDVIILRPDVDVDATFLGYAADCVPSRYQKSLMGRGVTVMHIYQSQLKNLIIAIPPIPEQRAIAEYLDSQSTRIDALRIKAEESIERLTEYRSALISAAVTGKIDVRGAAQADSGEGA